MNDKAETAAGQARAPDWLCELAARADGAPVTPEGLGGFYLSYTKFAAVFTMRGARQLVVSFDNLSVVRDRDPAREPWGAGFFRDRGWSVLGILAFDANWYRDPGLFAFLEGLRERGFFAGFDRVAFTGTSMGGYAACAFASLAPGATVIAFSPQSTLDRQVVPWEKRFNRGRKQDWSGPFADGARESRKAGRVYLVYDPHDEGDRRHAERFRAPNVVRLRAFYSGHRTVVFLRRAELLKDVMGGAIEGTLTPREYYAAFRRRRELPWFHAGLFERCLRRPTPLFGDRVIAALERAGRPRTAELLRRRRAGETGAVGAGEDPAGETEDV